MTNIHDTVWARPSVAALKTRAENPTTKKHRWLEGGWFAPVLLYGVLFGIFLQHCHVSRALVASKYLVI